jgi:glyoxylase-like metal-dependent hydrolase (beta-lactamase superfamily II)
MVVDHDDLRIRCRLAEYRFYDAGDVVFLVSGRNHDRNRPAWHYVAAGIESISIRCRRTEHQPDQGGEGENPSDNEHHQWHHPPDDTPVARFHHSTTTVGAMALRQEQEPASTEIIEVAPGVRRVQLPIQIPGLGHVNCYAMEDHNGFTVMDPGLPGEESFADLEAAFARADIPLKRVHTVVVTHSHPDHFGGAARLRAHSNAEVVTHRAFRLVWDALDGADDEPDALAELDPSGDAPRLVHPFDRPTPWGGATFQPMDADHRSRVIENMRNPFSRPRPTVRLDEADTIQMGGRRFVAMHTPGHTQDHLCLYDPESGVLFSGDHVLPTITPHIGGMDYDADPLNDYFESLRRVQAIPGINTVLPAHGQPFHNLGARVDEIIEHHIERLARLGAGRQELGRTGSVSDYMKFLFRERSWGSMAESETFAHLEHLRRTGQATVDRVNGELFYDVAPSVHV